MKISDRYFVDPSFEENPVLTFDTAGQDTYWNASHIGGARFYQRPVYDLAYRKLLERGGQVLVDVGCGAAPKLDWLQRRNRDIKIVGIDQPSAIAFCRAHWNFGQWFEANLDEPLPASIPRHVADVTICADVIEHVRSPEVLLNHLRAVTKHDGLIVVSTPERLLTNGPHAKRSPNKYHVREWTTDEFGAMLKYFGFKVLDQQLQMPMNLHFGRLAWEHIIKRRLKGLPTHHNQVAILQPGY